MAPVGIASSASCVGEEPAGKELEVHNGVAIPLEDFCSEALGNSQQVVPHPGSVSYSCQS